MSALLAAIACGAAVPLLTRLPDYLGAGLFFLVALATIWLLKADYSAKAAAASLFCDQYGYLAREWRDLWYGEPTQARINGLWEKYQRIAQRVRYSHGPQTELEGYGGSGCGCPQRIRRGR